MGHFDYVARYAPYPKESILYRDFPGLIDEILKYLVENEGKLTEMLLDVPKEVDLAVANRKLASLGVRIDALTPEQKDYLFHSSV